LPTVCRDYVLTPDGKTLYVGSDGPFGGAIIPISTATDTAGQPIPVAAEDIAITPDGKTLYAAARQGSVWSWRQAGSSWHGQIRSTRILVIRLD